jgi:predicted RecB family nuclease
VKLTSDGIWSVASRDLIRASKCDHCVAISAAVAAGNTAVRERIELFKDDPAASLIVIQGREWEEIVFRALEASVAKNEFLNIDNVGTDKFDSTRDAVREGVPIIAQAAIATSLRGVDLVGKPDLLVRSDYRLTQKEPGVVIAKCIADVWDGGYTVWDVKNGSKVKPEYLIQLGQYIEQLGTITEVAGAGVVHSWGNDVSPVEVAKASSHFQKAFDRLSRVLATKTNTDWATSEIESWSCPERGTCSSIHCEYPNLCAKTWKESDSVVLLPSFGSGNIKKLKAARFETVSSVALASESERPDSLKDETWRKFQRFAKVMAKESLKGPSVEGFVGYTLSIPSPSPHDLFFDIEWFNPVTSDQALVFMFGVVDANEEFTLFTTDDFEGELKAFDDFLDFALSRVSNTDGRIYHYNNPETIYLKKLSNRYGGHRAKDVRFLISRMVDLMKEAKLAFIPGSGSYSIKKLERYYDADTKLQRDKLVKGGEDAMLNFHLRLEALRVGDISHADELLDNVARYNQDDCLSTKLLRDWLLSVRNG